MFNGKKYCQCRPLGGYDYNSVTSQLQQIGRRISIFEEDEILLIREASALLKWDKKPTDFHRIRGAVWLRVLSLITLDPCVKSQAIELLTFLADSESVNPGSSHWSDIIEWEEEALKAFHDPCEKDELDRAINILKRVAKNYNISDTCCCTRVCALNLEQKTPEEIKIIKVAEQIQKEFINTVPEHRRNNSCSQWRMGNTFLQMLSNSLLAIREGNSSEIVSEITFWKNAIVGLRHDSVISDELDKRSYI